MKPDELTLDKFRQMVLQDMIDSFKMNRKEAERLAAENPDVVEDNYKEATDEAYFARTHKQGDSAALARFREGGQIRPAVGKASYCLFMMA
ncbi:MAG: hypothetical protein J6Y62_00600 [Clostridia bacterium]|nr:hypothetical protein [Clostridia bacterium]